jgi:hypothetical protein
MGKFWSESFKTFFNNFLFEKILTSFFFSYVSFFNLGFGWVGFKAKFRDFFWDFFLKKIVLIFLIFCFFLDIGFFGIQIGKFQSVSLQNFFFLKKKLNLYYFFFLDISVCIFKIGKKRQNYSSSVFIFKIEKKMLKL